jgi:hypothetical protein
MIPEPVFKVRGHERLQEVETIVNSQDMVNCKTQRCLRFSSDSLPRSLRQAGSPTSRDALCFPEARCKRRDRRVGDMDSPSFLDPQLKLGGVKALLPRINNDRCPGS